MCGENQKTLKFYTKKRKKESPVPDTLGSSPAEVPQAPLGAPGTQWEPAGRPGGAAGTTPLGRPGLGADWK